jgi:hypothetical protein
MKLFDLFLCVIVPNIQATDINYHGRNKMRHKRDPSSSIKFEARTGRDSLLACEALNSTHLEVHWTHSFDLDLDMVQSAVLYSAENIIATQIGQAEPPFYNTSSIITNCQMDLCLAHKLFVSVNPKEGYQRTHILRETTWYPPNFLKVILNTYLNKLMP